MDSWDFTDLLASGQSALDRGREVVERLGPSAPLAISHQERFGDSQLFCEIKAKVLSGDQSLNGSILRAYELEELTAFKAKVLGVAETVGSIDWSLDNAVGTFDIRARWRTLENVLFGSFERLSTYLEASMKYLSEKSHLLAASSSSSVLAIRVWHRSEYWKGEALRYIRIRERATTISQEQEEVEAANDCQSHEREASLANRAQKSKRISSSIGNWNAVKKMHDYITAKNLKYSEFALRVGTTERTLRNFRNTNKLKFTIFDKVASELGLTRDELLG